MNWTSANAGFAQCRASARVSLSPVTFPPWGGNVHERPTRRVHRKKGVRYRIDLLGIQGKFSLYEPVSNGLDVLQVDFDAAPFLRCTLVSTELRQKSQWFSCRTVSLYSLILQFAGVRLSLLREGGTQLEKRIFWKWPNASKISMEDWFLRGNFSELTSESIQR